MTVQVRNVERKKSFIVRNNALLIVSREKDLFLSSAKWNRDKVIDEEIGPLWKVESGDGASRCVCLDFLCLSVRLLSFLCALGGR